jgi:hypothetical protein
MADDVREPVPRLGKLAESRGSNLLAAVMPPLERPPRAEADLQRHIWEKSPSVRFRVRQCAQPMDASLHRGSGSRL